MELESAKLGASLLGRPQPMYAPTAALVTNLSVHLKWGHEVSVAWVTTLDRGQPVPRARVTVQDCAGSVLWTGLTDDQGIARITGLPKNWKDVRHCQERSDWVQFDFTQTEAIRNLDGGLFVVAQTQDDLSFVHSSWRRGIEPWRFRLPYEDYRGPIAVHTILDRSLLRAGETVHMKHILRKRTLDGFAGVPEAERPTRLVIQHLGSEQQYEFPLQWDASGIAETTWAIPKDAKLGSYQLEMVFQSASGGTWKWLSGGFRVEEFRLALTRGTIRLAARPRRRWRAGTTERMDWAQTPRGDTLRLPWPAKREELTVSHEGSGKPWITTLAQAAVPLKTPLSTGYRITRAVRPVEQRVPGRWSKGDVLRVRLDIEAESDMTWVVVSDPIPAGASHLGTGLGGDSLIATRGENWKGCACFAFAERAFEGFRAYYEFFPKGKSVVEYTIRLNQAGYFQLPTTRVEALYSPEMFGELPNEASEVHP